jgi:DNA polymerase III subunit delta'
MKRMTDRMREELPTISNRCQIVLNDPTPVEKVEDSRQALGMSWETAMACARLSLGDAHRARDLAEGEGQALREAGEAFARAALHGEASAKRPWLDLLAMVRAKGESLRQELERQASADLELYPRKEQKRVETEWSERIRRSRRRAETTALDLALQVSALWFSDLAALAWGADELVRNVDRLPDLRAYAGAEPTRLLRAVELIEETRQRFQLNVSEELACEALAYRLEAVFSG